MEAGYPETLFRRKPAALQEPVIPMYLKRIEICGFKSFVDSTILELTPGIASIIGPNGCGKSNVLDAVRWVLGEQNPRVLRADKMADLIWAGSSTRKATSFAEATLIFADCDKVLSMDFHEIAITRRLYRTGESEYLINKAVCRLKDIESLFMDTGLGPHAYSIMEQGKIDQLLQMKPEQRRFIFEEAAGITKYQTRKEEAVRKLGRTEENLLRLNDIITEVKRQVNSVERQARQARRYQEFETELRKLEVSFSKKEFDRLTEGFKEYSQKLKETQVKSTSLTDTINKSETEYETVRTRGAEIEGHLSQNQQEKYNTENQIERIEAQIKISRSMITTSDETIQTLESEITQLEERVKELDNQKSQLTEQQNEFNGKITEQRKVISEHQQSLNSIIQEQRLLETNIQQTLNAMRQKNERSARLQGELGAIGASLVGINNRRNEISHNITDKEQSAADLAARIELARQRMAGFEESIKSDRETITQINHQIDENKTKKNALLKELDQVKYTLSGKQSRRISLLTLKESYEGYQSGTKTLLQSKKAQTPECAGIVTTVAEIIRTRPEYEIAIESALIHSLNYLITEKVDQARSALDYLNRNKKGTATILPLDLLRDGTPKTLAQDISSREGIIGIASDLITYDEAYRSIIENLLGRVLIVKNMEAAIQLVRDGAFNGEIVTLSGERVFGYGAISGGSVKTAGLLAQDREIGELAGQIQKLEEIVQNLQAQITESDKAFTELDNQRNEKQRSLHEFDIQRAQAQRDVESLSGQQKHLTNEIQSLQSIQANSQTEEDKQKTRQLQFQEELKRIEEEVQSGQKQIEEWRNAQGEISQKREFQNQLITQIQVELATLENQAKNFQQQVSRVISELQSQSYQIRQKQEQKQSALNKKKEADELITQSEQSRGELTVKLEELTASLTRLQAEKAQVEEQINQLSRLLAELRRDHSQVQNEVHELEMQVKDFNWKIDSLRQRIQETYHLDIQDPIELEDVDLTDEVAVNNRIAELKHKIERMGPINFGALEEFEEAQKRYEQLIAQEEDAKSAIASLRATINHINSTTKDLFIDTFNAAQKNFHEVFRHLFRGGNAKLTLIDEENPLESGIDVIVQPPGKNLQSINLLSGGEKALSAIALLFSIYLLKPSPVCVLDEIDAPLDDVNIGRFTDMVKEMVNRSQFLVITHNKRTMESANNLYGVTMEEPGVSKVVAVRVTGEALYDGEVLADMNFNQGTVTNEAPEVEI